MPTAQQLRERLTDKLKELFQLNQPDLDFGFYRIMHAKADQVTEFLENDLLAIVEQAFGDDNETKLAELRKAYEDAVDQAREFGADKPEETKPVREAKAALDAAADTSKAEGEVYDHLYRFFERYYEDGDFISRRYYARETGSKAAAYAIPYSGEEVKLHWANADQYYIKTAEHFNHFSFDLSQAPETADIADEMFGPTDERTPMRVHFRIVEAAEGEHGNIKASEQTKRYFIVHKGAAIEFDEAGDLTCRFEFRPDPEKTGQDSKWREKRNAEAVEAILEALARIDSDSADVVHDTLAEKAKAYASLLRTPAPTDSQKNRPLLAKYVGQYTARNTMDHFIHKDLGGFLRRELDFYIKNEVMRLDDIASADAPRVANYLGKLKVLRTVASKIIDFLAQLEDFQKKLWLKRKFVVEAHYCITLDRIIAIADELSRTWLLERIAANEAQREEWVRLFAIDEIDGTPANPLLEEETVAYTEPLTVDFLQANPALVVDSRHFEPGFTMRLVQCVADDDAQNGVVFHGDNFDALRTMEARYNEQIGIVFIDPPYNTGEDGFIYRDAYQHSSWMAMMDNRLRAMCPVVNSEGLFFSTIDFVEVSRLRLLCDDVFGSENFLADVAWEKRYTRSNNAKRFYSLKDTLLVYRATQQVDYIREDRSEKSRSNYTNPDDDPRGPWISSSYVNPATKQQRPNLVYEIRNPITGQVIAHPTHAWKYDPDTHQGHVEDDRLYWGLDGGYEYPRLKSFLSEASEGMVPVDVWHYQDSGTTDEGGKQVKDIFGYEAFSNPKPTKLIRRCMTLSPLAPNSTTVLDFFAGSGSTAHAVIEANRQQESQIRYVMIELGHHCQDVLIPRLKRLAYSDTWENGRPCARDNGISHCFKYVRLESYEDCLNNLALADDPDRVRLLKDNPQFREDYILRYMLDVDTRGSSSLLDIDAFADPTSYKLKVKRPGSDEYVWKNVDLLETFNYLIGLRVEHIAAPQTFAAEFERPVDPELPKDQNTRLQVKDWSGPDSQGRVKTGAFSQADDGPWWFRKVEGWIPADLAHPNNGQREKVLIVWRKLTDNLEQDNLMLDCWFQANRISTRDWEFDTIYVNGSNNLPNLQREGDQWKVRLIEEDFHRLMWDVEEV